MSILKKVKKIVPQPTVTVTITTKPKPPPNPPSNVTVMPRPPPQQKQPKVGIPPGQVGNFVPVEGQQNLHTSPLAHPRPPIKMTREQAKKSGACICCLVVLIVVIVSVYNSRNALCDKLMDEPIWSNTYTALQFSNGIDITGYRTHFSVSRTLATGASPVLEVSLMNVRSVDSFPYTITQSSNRVIITTTDGMMNNEDCFLLKVVLKISSSLVYYDINTPFVLNIANSYSPDGSSTFRTADISRLRFRNSVNIKLTTGTVYGEYTLFRHTHKGQHPISIEAPNIEFSKVGPEDVIVSTKSSNFQRVSFDEPAHWFEWRIDTNAGDVQVDVSGIYDPSSYHVAGVFDTSRQVSINSNCRFTPTPNQSVKLGYAFVKLGEVFIKTATSGQDIQIKAPTTTCPA
ncbi:hypothetical protein RCL1_008209 [Eukaryota sp. TZLM3-RCL]